MIKQIWISRIANKKKNVIDGMAELDLTGAVTKVAKKTVISKIVKKNILGGAIDGNVVLGPSSFNLLKDTLACLASDEIKLASLKSRQEEDIDEGKAEQDLAGAIENAAKKAVIILANCEEERARRDRPEAQVGGGEA